MEYQYPWALTEMNPWNEWWERQCQMKLDALVTTIWKQCHDEGHEVCMFLEEDFKGVKSLFDLGMIPNDIDGLYLGRRRVPNHEWLYGEPEQTITTIGYIHNTVTTTQHTNKRRIKKTIV